MGNISLIQGDITKQTTGAIVNAANSSLLGGGGVDGAIHKAGGKALLDECIQIRNRQGGCKTGEAVITTGGNLPAPYVIHTVGPVWNGGNGNEARLLENCYRNSLQLAVDHHITSISFPNISTGIYRYPKNEAAAIAVTTVRSFMQQHAAIEAVVFVCFDKENYDIYDKLLRTQ